MNRILIAAAALLPAWGAASAQEAPVQTTETQNDQMTPAPAGHRVRVGIGAQLQPKFVGAGTGDLSPLLHVSIARGNEPFRFSAPDDSFSIALVRSGPFSFGPAANLTGSRKEKDVGAPVGDVKRTIEAGGFVNYWIGQNFRLRGEVRKGLNGHKGVVGNVGADVVWRDGDRYVFSVGPRVLFSDARYQRAYFEVTPAASLASGLPVYRPGGGIHAIGLASGYSVQLSPQFGLFDYVRYERLIGDAAKSPMVRQFGSRNQVSVGLGVSYTFGM